MTAQPSEQSLGAVRPNASVAAGSWKAAAEAAHRAFRIAAARRRQALLRAVERHRARSPKSSPVPRTEAAPPDAAAHRPSWSTAGLPVDRRHTALAGGSPRRDPDLEPVLPMPQHAAARGGLPLAQPHPLPAYDPSPPGAAAGSDDESDFPLGDVALPTLPVGSASLGDDDGDGDAETDRADAPGRRLSLADAPMPLLPLRTRSDVTGAARMDVSPWHPRAAAPDSPLGSALGGAAHSLADALHLDMASLLRESPPPRLHLHADLASDPLYAGLELATPFVPTPPLEAMASATGRIASWPGPWASDDMLAGRAAAVDVPFAPASAAVTGGGSLSAHVLPRLSVGTVPLTRFDGSPLPYRRLLHPSASAGASGILLSARSSHAGLRSGGGVQAAVAGLTEVASSDVLGRRQQDLAQHLHDLSP
ncbi:hypothetical protein CAUPRSCDRAFT_12001 [Caulochytrium protostelioides]|uniref:Uncharacterized protein n=1 Tax=Caulochytrium protostelioides TaxID=1555241 RepID=A0A4P9WYC7_9FUNG|nr:hypothetical protein CAUPRSCDRAFT_12001 [Caulochytrium protostelioides]